MLALISIILIRHINVDGGGSDGGDDGGVGGDIAVSGGGGGGVVSRGVGSCGCDRSSVGSLSSMGAQCI